MLTVDVFVQSVHPDDLRWMLPKLLVGVHGWREEFCYAQSAAGGSIGPDVMHQLLEVARSVDITTIGIVVQPTTRPRLLPNTTILRTEHVILRYLLSLLLAPQSPRKYRQSSNEDSTSNTTNNSADDGLLGVAETTS